MSKIMVAAVEYNSMGVPLAVWGVGSDDHEALKDAEENRKRTIQEQWYKDGTLNFEDICFPDELMETRERDHIGAWPKWQDLDGEQLLDYLLHTPQVSANDKQMGFEL